MQIIRGEALASNFCGDYTMKQIQIADFILRYVALDEIQQFKRQLIKWDSSATGDSFCAINILHGFLTK